MFTEFGHDCLMNQFESTCYVVISKQLFFDKIIAILSWRYISKADVACQSTEDTLKVLKAKAR